MKCCLLFSNHLCEAWTFISVTLSHKILGPILRNKIFWYLFKLLFNLMEIGVSFYKIGPRWHTVQPKLGPGMFEWNDPTRCNCLIDNVEKRIEYREMEPDTSVDKLKRDAKKTCRQKSWTILTFTVSSGQACQSLFCLFCRLQTLKNTANS